MNIDKNFVMGILSKMHDNDIISVVSGKIITVKDLKEASIKGDTDNTFENVMRELFANRMYEILYVDGQRLKDIKKWYYLDDGYGDTFTIVPAKQSYKDFIEKGQISEEIMSTYLRYMEEEACEPCTREEALEHFKDYDTRCNVITNVPNHLYFFSNKEMTNFLSKYGMEIEEEFEYLG